MNPRRALLALLGALGLSLAAAVPAFAHPLGNFTINRFSQVQLNGDRIDILYVIDYAEIPAFQEKQRIADDAGYIDHQVRDLSKGLILQAAGHTLGLIPASSVSVRCQIRPRFAIARKPFRLAASTTERGG